MGEFILSSVSETDELESSLARGARDAPYWWIYWMALRGMLACFIRCRSHLLGKAHTLSCHFHRLTRFCFCFFYMYDVEQCQNLRLRIYIILLMKIWIFKFIRYCRLCVTDASTDCTSCESHAVSLLNGWTAEWKIKRQSKGISASMCWSFIIYQYLCSTTLHQPRSCRLNHKNAFLPLFTSWRHLSSFPPSAFLQSTRLSLSFCASVASSSPLLFGSPAFVAAVKTCVASPVPLSPTINPLLFLIPLHLLCTMGPAAAYGCESC